MNLFSASAIQKDNKAVFLKNICTLTEYYIDSNTIILSYVKKLVLGEMILMYNITFIH